MVFRSQIKEALNGVDGIEVVGTANNGKIALQKLKNTPVDLITLDMEMPEMDGIETLKELRKNDNNTKVICFSSHTMAGSKKTLEALREGAEDFVTKPSGKELNISNAAGIIAQALVPKIQQFMTTFKETSIKPNTTGSEKITPIRSLDYKNNTATKLNFIKKNLDIFKPHVVVIGSSTGGPVALEKIFQSLKGAQLRIPILITQHMPPVFTASLAERLARTTGLPAAEAIHGQPLENKIYVAPGGFHLRLIKTNDSVMLNLDQNAERNNVRPAVDFLFESAAEIFGPLTMGFILTGMGDDGLKGSLAIKSHQGGIMIQNKESCVVFGMPRAIYEAQAHDAIGDLNLLAKTLKKMVII